MGNGWVLGNFFYFSFLHKILWIFFFQVECRFVVRCRESLNIVDLKLEKYLNQLKNCILLSI